MSAATPFSLPATMKAVVTTGNGGYDKLVFCDVPVPRPGPGEVVLQVLAAGVNNTEINTRLGWYSATVTSGTAAAAAAEERQAVAKADGGLERAAPRSRSSRAPTAADGWSPCRGVDTPPSDAGCWCAPACGERGFDSMENIWMGSDFDGAFAQFVSVPADRGVRGRLRVERRRAGHHPLRVRHGGEHAPPRRRGRRGPRAGDRRLGRCRLGGRPTGEATRRHGHGVAGRPSSTAVRALGVDRVIDRGRRPRRRARRVQRRRRHRQRRRRRLREAAHRVMARGGRYASSGAIAGPVVTLDMRTFYLKDLTPHRLHRLGRTGLPQPRRLHRARRDPPAWSPGRSRSSTSPRPSACSSRRSTSASSCSSHRRPSPESGVRCGPLGPAHGPGIGRLVTRRRSPPSERTQPEAPATDPGSSSKTTSS